MLGICEEGSQQEKLFVFPSNSDKSEELTMKGERAGRCRNNIMANPETHQLKAGPLAHYADKGVDSTMNGDNTTVASTVSICNPFQDLHRR
jgi:hypothetical protein